MLDFAHFALQEQLEDNLMVSISRAWYNGSYTMAAKPIKSLELHYRMIPFLIIGFIPDVSLLTDCRHFLWFWPVPYSRLVSLPCSDEGTGK